MLFFYCRELEKQHHWHPETLKIKTSFWLKTSRGHSGASLKAAALILPPEWINELVLFSAWICWRWCKPRSVHAEECARPGVCTPRSVHTRRVHAEESERKEYAHTLRSCKECAHKECAHQGACTLRGVHGEECARKECARSESEDGCVCADARRCFVPHQLEAPITAECCPIKDEDPVVGVSAVFLSVAIIWVSDWGQLCQITPDYTSCAASGADVWVTWALLCPEHWDWLLIGGHCSTIQRPYLDPTPPKKRTQTERVDLRRSKTLISRYNDLS